MRKLSLLIFILSIAIMSCNKNDAPSGLQANQLTSPNASPVSWHLTGYSISGVNQPLSITQQHFSKKYTADQNFTTSDGFKGTWKIVGANTLIETYTNFPVNNIAAQFQTYTVSATPSTLILKYANYADSITTTYTVGN